MLYGVHIIHVFMGSSELTQSTNRSVNHSASQSTVRDHTHLFVLPRKERASTHNELQILRGEGAIINSVLIKT